jgi:hypothetical protein
MFQEFGVSPLSLAFTSMAMEAAVAGRYEEAAKDFSSALSIQERQELRMIGQALVQMEQDFGFDGPLVAKAATLRQALQESLFSQAVFAYIEIWMQLHADHESMRKAMRYHMARPLPKILWDLAEMLKLDIQIPFT